MLPNTEACEAPEETLLDKNTIDNDPQDTDEARQDDKTDDSDGVHALLV
jgi:hypothetical protein